MVNEDLGNITRLQLDQMISTLESMPIGLPLVWLYVWDIMRSEYESMSYDEGYTESNPLFGIDDVWNALWVTPVFSLEFGPEELSEHIREWLMDNKFILDSELDGESEDMVESTSEEV